MMIHLYYRDKNRQHRGYAENHNLLVDYSKKQFETYTNPFYWYRGAEHIETSKKSDILEHEKMLKNRWFTETKF